MAFSDFYSRRGDETSRNKESNFSILPFFGFKYDCRTDDNISIKHSSPTATYVGDGKFKVERGVGFVTNDKSYTEVYKRSTTPEGKELEMENEFINAVGKGNNIFSGDAIWNTQYIPASLSEFIKKRYTNLGAFLLKVVILFVMICVAVELVGVIVPSLGEKIAAFFDKVNSTPDGDTKLVAILLVPIVICAIIKALMNHKLRRTPIDKLSENKRNRIIRKYKKSMIFWYGKEAGNILWAYAQYKGYDKV